jgi:hypothetical protein
MFPQSVTNKRSARAPVAAHLASLEHLQVQQQRTRFEPLFGL